MASRGIDVECGPSGGVTRQSGAQGAVWECQWCGADFGDEARKRGQRYCSARCKDRAYNHRNPVARQRHLFEAQPVPPVVDQRVPQDESLTLRGHNVAVMARLRMGPATGPELERLLGPGSAWRTRVSDVRRWLGRTGETVRARRLAPRLWVYRIEAL